MNEQKLLKKKNVKNESANKKRATGIHSSIDMLPSYRTMKYKSPIWGYFHVQKE